MSGGEERRGGAAAASMGGVARLLVRGRDALLLEVLGLSSLPLRSAALSVRGASVGA